VIVPCYNEALTIGFLVDVAVLYAALTLGANRVAGRLLSFLAAAGFTWRFNRCYTFTATDSPWREWWPYLASMAAGMLIKGNMLPAGAGRRFRDGLRPSAAVGAELRPFRLCPVTVQQ
jgi:hypothetical protein